MPGSMIYLDNNATTRIDDLVLEAMLPYLRDCYGNPASSHALGRAARDAVELARLAVACLIGAREGRIVFTASATEANNLVIDGLLAAAPSAHVVTTMIEHKSVLEPLLRLEKRGCIRVTWLRPDSFGQVHLEDLEAAITAETRLVSIIAASNIVHTLNPLAELAALCRNKGVLLHCDATQWIGRLPLDAESIGIDALCVSAHKFYGPKGAAAAYFSRSALQAGVAPQTLGGGQEDGMRSGTLNVPAIVGLGAACALSAQRQVSDATHLCALAERLLQCLLRRNEGITLNGHPAKRLPGGLHLTLAGVDSKALIASLPQLAISEGSACETDRDPDYVLKALGLPDAAHHSIRCQIGRSTTTDEIDRAVELLTAGIARMRQFES